MSLSSSHVLKVRNFGQTSAMTLRAAETRGQKRLNQFPGECVTDNEAPEADHVQIVVLDTLMRGKGFVDQARPHARHLVGGNGCTDPAPADGHASTYLLASDGASQRHNEIRIVIVPRWLEIAKIDHLMTGFAQHPEQVFL